MVLFGDLTQFHVDSPFRSKLSEGILKLQENGRLQWIQQRWWNPKRFCDSEEEEDGGRDNDDDVHGEDHSQRETVEIRQLHGADLAGAFAILYMGLILAGLLAIGELFYVFSTRANRYTAAPALCYAFLILIKFALAVGSYSHYTSPLQRSEVKA
ncbi:hypothetical protein HPB47_011621 [Ixodes persulcatus]|uniref:Uncharacterized protein n=1 Tax=Ixodes persulcatus TaxID=34615 RepID=A0AC60NWP9_IXOPE|nr:hypothetical protein HPB47_011621 [Ixodes persulcatus]